MNPLASRKLEYSAVRERRLPPWWPVRLALILAIGATMIAAAVWFGPSRRADLWARLPLPGVRTKMSLAEKYQQELAALHEWEQGYAVPQGTVVYEEGPAATASQWATPVGRFTQMPDPRRPGRAIRVRMPRPTPLCAATGNYPFQDETGVLLLARLRTPDGRDVLTAVLRSPPLPAPNESTSTPQHGIEQILGHQARTPATLTHYTYFTQEQLPPTTTSQVVRFFPGELDSADSSHFTVGYELDGKKGAIDGWLRGDLRIHLRIRDGAPRPPESPPADGDRRYRRSGAKVR